MVKDVEELRTELGASVFGQATFAFNGPSQIDAIDVKRFLGFKRQNVQCHTSPDSIGHSSEITAWNLLDDANIRLRMPFLLTISYSSL